MIVIGFCGDAGAGKNTAAGLLAGVLVERGRSVAVDAFATALKQHARLHYGWRGQKDEEGRRLLQEVGDKGREVQRDFWIALLARRYGETASDPPSHSYGAARPADRSCRWPPYFLIVTDVRFANEFVWCAERGAVWVVERPRGPDPIRTPAEEWREHRSEQWRSELAASGVTAQATLLNDGSVGDLLDRVKRVAGEMLL